MANIIIISHYAKTLINFRSELIKEMIELGHNVTTLAPEKNYKSKINALGAKYIVYPLNRTGINPFDDLRTILSLMKIIRNLKPDIVFSYSTKPIIYGSLAAQISGVKNIYSMITGLGYVFVRKENRRSPLKNLVKLLYKIALKYNNVVFFQNPDDLNLLLRLRLIKDKNKTLILNGSGINLEKYYFAPLKEKSISFLLIARLIWDKGIYEYIEAARIIKKKYPNVSFLLLGPNEKNPCAIKKEYIKKWANKGIINYLGEKDDVRPYIANSSVFVLPSYREGIPRSILEAMAMGRPVITTNSPGCRETVEDGVNGFLVPIKDSKALADRMEKFILNPDLIKQMGNRSREIAEKRFDVYKVNRIILEHMGIKKTL